MRLLVLTAVLVSMARGGILSRGPARMICHRTANTEMPENTLESLDLAGRMGCSVVEIDLRMTLDGEIVLNHDGFLERLTNGIGQADASYFDELQLLDAGSWMGRRFEGLRIPRFVDALHIARKYGIGLSLDFKDNGMGPAVLSQLRQEAMLENVRFGGEWQDVKQSYSGANQDSIASIEPPVNRDEIETLHRQGKTVIANFSANGHEMDLPGMRAAVAAGVDWINVDYPRLGAEAIRQPVEAKLRALITKAGSGPAPERAKAILQLARYPGFPLEDMFRTWIVDSDDRVSRAAALALLIMRPAAPDSIFLAALQAPQSTARKNAAWALGRRADVPAESFRALLQDKDSGVLEEALLAISRCPGNMSVANIEPFLEHEDPLVRGAAALALARHQPETAVAAIRHALEQEEATVAKEYAPFIGQRAPRLSRGQIDVTVGHYRALMKLIASGAALHDPDALNFLEREAFRSVSDYSSTVGPVAGYQLWDRVAADAAATIRALAAPDPVIANRAEWILIQAAPSVLPAIRSLLQSDNQAVRERAIRIAAWKYDTVSLTRLRALRDSGSTDAPLVTWAIQKIEAFTATP
jgi:HEAT repeat protein